MYLEESYSKMNDLLKSPRSAPHPYFLTIKKLQSSVEVIVII